MNKKIALFIENGSEELEFVAPLDIMRRAGINVDLISANENKQIKTSHNLNVKTDKTINDIENILDYDGIIIPGGLPGSEYLKNNNKIIDFYKKMHANNKLVAAICAAPIVLNEADITKDKNITCYPGFENQIQCKKYDRNKAIVVDKNVITAQGPAVAILFGLEIVKYLLGEEESSKISNAMLVNVLKENL